MSELPRPQESTGRDADELLWIMAKALNPYDFCYDCGYELGYWEEGCDACILAKTVLREAAIPWVETFPPRPSGLPDPRSNS